MCIRDSIQGSDKKTYSQHFFFLFQKNKQQKKQKGYFLSSISILEVSLNATPSTALKTNCSSIVPIFAPSPTNSAGGTPPWMSNLTTPFSTNTLIVGRFLAYLSLIHI
eukprot:TRINITY_DN5564_c0_g1_i11.p1 TRINITY_DN5564_c0_g1~~TRINITY_DN5564_c0_g1_i11.p1  ORF type:complete len:125 (+),score=27.99 TRINITY_DN5564_c0_g1_i11:52-375(+)